jgi:hypothetical protein
LSRPGKITGFGWFGAGYAVFKSSIQAPDFCPSLNEMEAQQQKKLFWVIPSS